MILKFILTNIRRGVGFKCAKIPVHHPRVFKVSLSTELCKSRPTIVGHEFHTSSPRNALPPLFVFLLRYVFKIGAVISGRALRKWWARLSPEERAKVWEAIHMKKTKIAIAGTLIASGGYLNYVAHIVEDPITKRKRFIMLNQKQMNQIGDFENSRQLQMYRTAIIPPFHPIHRRVERVATNLLLSNADLKGVRDKKWGVTVVDRPDITNAFALPNGKIFVFSGMLNVCTNDDQLSVVLAHEIAHSILSHVAENMSRILLMDFILLFPTILIWMIFPDAWAIFSEWITSGLTNIFIHLPFSRAIEKEADMVGLQLAARSCYDVREAPAFWGKMKYMADNFPVEWLSTHPSHAKRQMDLKELLPNALRIREGSNCPPLRLKFTAW